jgi:sulfate adenylyltransferase subunit 1
VVLVDITKLEWSSRPVALLPQTRRHALLARLLRVPHIVFAINKLDAVDDPGAAYAAVAEALREFASAARIADARIVPVSALRGDNVTEPLRCDWYDGPSLLQVLEALPATHERTDGDLLVPIQYVAREGAAGVGEQPRTLWGRVAHGRVSVGDQVQLFPGNQIATVAELRRAGERVASVDAGQSAGIVLDRQLDVSRGDWIASVGTLAASQEFDATLAWLDVEPAQIGRKYWVRHGNRWVQARITAIEHRLDIQTLQPIDAHELKVNEIGLVRVEVQQPLPVEAYDDNRVGGALIVVDPTTNRTSGALLVRAAA